MSPGVELRSSGLRVLHFSLCANSLGHLPGNCTTDPCCASVFLAMGSTVTRRGPLFSVCLLAAGTGEPGSGVRRGRAVWGDHALLLLDGSQCCLQLPRPVNSCGAALLSTKFFEVESSRNPVSSLRAPWKGCWGWGHGQCLTGTRNPRKGSWASQG